MIAWPTAALLLAIVVFEGARRVHPGDVVFRRFLAGLWSVAELDALRRRWTLVSWLPPIWTTVVAPQRSGPGEPPAGLADRRRVLRPWYWTLTTLGAVELTALVAGVPLAERRFSGTGVLLAIGGALVLAVMVALVCWWARGQLGLPRAAAWAALSPFAAPYAAERLLDETLARFSTLAVARALLPPERFRSWVRPRAYDAQSSRGADPELHDAINGDELAAILAPPAASDGAPLFCPRCGAVYREGADCQDCAGVALQRFSGNLPSQGVRA